MGAAIEWLTGKPAVIRWGPDLERHGDPYIFTVVLEIKDGKAELKAASGKIAAGARRDIFAELAKLGIEEVTWDRLNTSNDRSVTAKTTRATWRRVSNTLEVLWQTWVRLAAAVGKLWR